MKKLLVVIFLLSVALITQAQEKTPDVKAILDTIDKLYRSDESYAEMEMQIVNPNWERIIKMNVWSKGVKKIFIRILLPEKDRGIATLRLDKEMWNYFPKVDKVMKVPPSMMMASWMGSDFTNDDLVKETTLLEDYDAKLLEPENKEEGLYYIELTPKEKTATVWGKIIARVKKDDYIPVSEEYFDENGKKARIIEFREVGVLGGRKLPTVMEVTPLNKKGNRTIVRYKKVEFNNGVPETVFSLRNLQKKI